MPTLGLKLRLNRITARILRVITDGLVLWQKMVPSPWTGSFRMIDASGTGNDGDLYTGRTMAFDGTNDVITIGDTSQNVKTVVFWVWPDTTTEKFMQLQASGAVDIGITSGTLSGTGWTSPTYYVNGVAGTSVSSGVWQIIAVTSATAIDASDVKLGLSNADYFDGKLSNVIFYGSELTANQVAQLYALPESPIPSGLGAGDIVGWWTLAESTAPGIALDGSGNNNNGAISGASDLLAQNGAVPQWGFKGNSWPMWLDGAGDYIDCSLSKYNQFSISVWYINTKTVVSQYLWRYATSTGSLLIYPGTNTENIVISDFSNESYTVGLGSHTSLKVNNITVTFNTVTLDYVIYYNGINVKSGAFVDLNWTGAFSYFRLGYGASGQFNGVIYNASIHDSILSDNEIASLYAAGIDHDLRVATGNYTSTANLKGYWVNTGNQNSDWVDLSGNGNNGTVNGSPGRIFLPEGLTPGKDVVGMTVDNPVNGEMYVPNSGYISVQDDSTLDLSTEFTIEFWLKLNNEVASGFVIEKILSYRVYAFAPQGRMYLDLVSGGTLTSLPSNTGALLYNQWVHYAITYDNVNVKHYINSSLDRTLSYASTIDNTANDVKISTTTNQIDDGYIDDVRIYNVALTADQVANNYNATKASHSN